MHAKANGTLGAFVKQCGVNPKSPVPVGNSMLLSTDIESGDAPAFCQRSVAQFGWRRSERSGRELFIGAGSRRRSAS
jgi:hypothetical protein